MKALAAQASPLAAFLLLRAALAGTAAQNGSHKLSLDKANPNCNSVTHRPNPPFALQLQRFDSLTAQTGRNGILGVTLERNRVITAGAVQGAPKPMRTFSTGSVKLMDKYTSHQELIQQQ